MLYLGGCYKSFDSLVASKDLVYSAKGSQFASVIEVFRFSQFIAYFSGKQSARLT